MLTVETKVNGNLISFTKIVNTGQIFKSGKYLYDVHHFNLDKGRITECGVTHSRQDGAVSLVEKVMKEIKEQEK